MRRFFRWLALFAIIALALSEALAGHAAADVPPVLRISAIPDENPNELLRIYTPFAEYLAREHVAFIGPSGAGKTTLVRLLNLTLRPTAGTLVFEGQDAAPDADPCDPRDRDARGRAQRLPTLAAGLRRAGF